MTFIVTSCGVIKITTKHNLADGPYRFRHEGEKYRKVKIHVGDDTVAVFSRDDAPVAVEPKTRYLLGNSFDIDVLVAPFKYRPVVQGTPRKLSSSFNGAVFMGYRWDRFKIEPYKNVFGSRRRTHHSGFTLGAFGGIGSAQINPWTTNYRTNDEYDGFVVTHGAAALLAFRHITAGVAVGFDRLTDRDKDIWIYQGKPWYGLVVGLNLN